MANIYDQFDTTPDGRPRITVNPIRPGSEGFQSTPRGYSTDDVQAAVRGDMFNSPGLPVKYAAQPGQTFGADATRNARPFEDVVAHHTGGATLQGALNSQRDPFTGQSRGYHFLIDTDGTVVQGAPMGARTNHVQPPNSQQRTDRLDISNNNSVGVSFVGNSSDPTPEQLAAAENLTHSLMDRYHIKPQNVVGHGEIQASRQPGEGMPLVNAIRNPQEPQVAQAAGPQMSGVANASTGKNIYDQFDAPSRSATQTGFGARFEGEPLPEMDRANSKLQSGLMNRAAELTTGQAISPAAQMAVQHANQLSAASQGTSPHTDSYKGRLLSTETFQDDAGNILFRDPQTGKMVTTDNSKHVALRDPTDNTVKVYSRDSSTNEGKVVGASRVLSQGLISGAPTARAAATLPAVLRPGQEAAIAAEKLGVEVPRVVTSDSMSVQRLGQGLKNVPFAGNPMVKGTQKALTQLGEAADDVAHGYGGGTVSGDAAKNGITEWITTRSSDNANKLYKAVDEQVNPEITRPLTNSLNTVVGILRERRAAGLPNGKAVESVLEAIQRPGMNYEGTKALRTHIGEMMNGGILPEGMSGGDLKRIYGALTKDLRETVRTAGGEGALNSFDKATRYYELASQRRAALAKIVGVDGNAPAELVFDRLLAKAGGSSRADIESLSNARKAMGADDWNELSSGIVSRLGRDVEGKFSPDRFLTAWGKLSDAGKGLLFKSTDKAGLATSLDNIAKVSSRFKEMNKFANPSGTAQSVIGPAMVAAIYAEPVTALSTILGGRITSHILASPAKAASAAQWAESYERLARTPSTPRVAQFTLATRNLLNNLKDQGVNLTPADFLRSIQSPVKSAAEGDQ